MYAYTFPDQWFGSLSGKTYHSTIPSKDVFWKRLQRLETLILLTEQHESGEGRSICKKALRAYNNTNNFTGIIRLTVLEKDWLGYLLESDMYDKEDIECINFYIRH